MNIEQLARAARAGLVAQRGPDPALEYVQRLDRELQQIEEHGFVQAYSIASEFVSWCRASSVPLGPGRGSTPGSLVSWALGITAPDPIRHGLWFERAASLAGDARPHFDLDLGCRDFGRAVDQLVAQNAPRATRLVASESFGAECIAVVAISPMNLRPRIHALTQRDAEAAGCIVLQLFGLGVVDDVASVGVDAIDCAEALELMARDDTDGIFGLQTVEQRRMLRAIDAAAFVHLTALTALDRAGPLEHGLYDRYRQARHAGAESIHPAVDRVLAETFGVLLYQEQAMEIFRDVAGFSLLEGDRARRELNKQREVSSLRARFLDGACERGTPRSTANRIFEDLHDGGGDTVMKSHAVAWGYLTMKSAVVRLRTPAGPRRWT